MNEQWYYGSNGQQGGPVDEAEIRARLASGALSAGDLLWREGMAEWTPAASVPAFAGVVPAALAAPAFAAPMGVPLGGTQPMMMGYYGGTEAVDRLTPAGFWLRVVAYIIDYIVTYAAGFAIGLVLGFSIALVLGGRNEAQTAIAIVSGLAGFVLTWLYFALMESSPRQATLGKMALGLRVVGANGERITFARATGRYFAKILSSITIGVGFIMVAFTQRKQGLHDLLATTFVIKNDPAIGGYSPAPR